MQKMVKHTWWSSAVGSTCLTAGGIRWRVAFGRLELCWVTPGSLVSELTVSRCVRITLGGALGTTGLLDVDVIAVTT